MAENQGQVYEKLPSSLIKVLPKEWLDSLIYLNIDDLREIRIRVGQPVLVKLVENFCFLGTKGCIQDKKNALLPTKQQVEDIVYLACDKSIYAYTRQMLSGFVPLPDGARMGVAGEVVYEKGETVCIKNFSALNIRIPHAVTDCSKKVKKFFVSPLKSVLVISPPSCGKTTFLRDMVYQLKEQKINTLIVDEREELTGLKNCQSVFTLNDCCDIMTNCQKNYAFEWGIRALSPQLVVCDELFLRDMPCIQLCILSGVKIFASVHAQNVADAAIKLKLDSFKGLFELYVVLSDRQGAGTVEGVFNAELMRLL